MTTYPKLVLLFGTPRSGTSWLGKIFDSHPDTLYKHEPDRTLNIPLAPGLEKTDQLVASIRDFCARLPLVNTPHVAGRLPVFQKRYRSGLRHYVHQASVMATGLA